ncbi:MAG: aldo/keto reductase, partial [Candidatus Glassbacteria bacterium]
MPDQSVTGRKDSRINRREFIRKSAAAAVGAAAVGALAGPAAAQELTVNGLPATVFGNTGLKVTKIAFGGIQTSEPTVLMRAIDSGINFIHTSPYYTNGRSIEAFGKVLKTHRQKVVIALKARPEELDRWLKVLNTDYVEMLVPPVESLADVSNDSVPENFEKARKAGKCGFMGYACHNDMSTILDRSRELGWYHVTLMGYSDASNPVFLEAAKKAREAGMGILTMKGLPKRGG